MSEERGKRDETSKDSSTPENAAARTGEAAADADNAASAVGAGSSTSGARPTGKRTVRKSSAAASTEKVSVTKAGSSRASVATRDNRREPKRMNIFKRLRKFLREVVSELRKVIWPNRKQMITYTSVVLVFMTFMVAFISGSDLLFNQGVAWLFG